MHRRGSPSITAEIAAGMLFRQSLWLNVFADDLKNLTPLAVRGEALELGRYASPVIAADPPDLPRKEKLATVNRRERKRARKEAMKLRQGQLKPKDGGEP